MEAAANAASAVREAQAEALRQQQLPKQNAFVALMDGARSAARAAASPVPAAHDGGRGGGGMAGGGRGRGRGRSSSLFPGRGGGRQLAPVPACQRIAGTSFVVDAFRYAPPADCRHFFLTHFHADHYAGLSRHFSSGLVYATPQTAALVALRLGCPRERLVVLPFDTPVLVCGVRVTAIDGARCRQAC